MATKKYDNGDGVKRHHYDVYELLGEKAYHIAPFTNESEAIRCAEAYAALAYVDREHFEIYPYETPSNTSSFVVRARATKDHNIFRHESADINRAVKNFGKIKDGLFSYLKDAEEPVEKVVDTGPKTKGKKKSKTTA